MIDPKFAGMLRCPINGTPLKIADEFMVLAVNGAIERSEARDRSDQKVELTIEGGLYCGGWLYPIRGGIPILVADAAIAIGDFVDSTK